MCHDTIDGPRCNQCGEVKGVCYYCTNGGNASIWVGKQCTGSVRKYKLSCGLTEGISYGNYDERHKDCNHCGNDATTNGAYIGWAVECPECGQRPKGHYSYISCTEHGTIRVIRGINDHSNNYGWDPCSYSHFSFSDHNYAITASLLPEIVDYCMYGCKYIQKLDSYNSYLVVADDYAIENTTVLCNRIVTNILPKK